MNSDEIEENINEIGQLYESNRGFIPCREKIRITACSYCTINNKRWYLNNFHLLSGNYKDKIPTCDDHLHGCTKDIGSSL